MNARSPRPKAALTMSRKPDTQEIRERVLTAANKLFVARGYAATSVKAIAAASGCSVGYIYKLFDGKLAILDELAHTHLDTYDKLRRRIRSVPGRSALDILRTELRDMCAHLVAHRGLIPILMQRGDEKPRSIRRKLQLMREEDVALLDQAIGRGEVPPLNPRLLAAAIDGATWGLIASLAPSEHDAVFLRVPEIIDTLIFEPLERRAPRRSGKEPAA